MVAGRSRSISSSASPPLRSGCRERRKTEVRQRLFRAALQLFGTRGFNATTVEDITRAADVGKGTFFNYFATKEMLLSNWAELRLDILRAAEAEVQKGLLPTRDILRRLFFKLMEEPACSQATARCMLLGLLGSEPIAGMAQGTAARAREILTNMMTVGQQRAEIRRDATAADLAQLFQQTFFGFLHLWVLLPNQSLSRRLNAAFDLFWGAVAARPARTRKRAS